MINDAERHGRIYTAPSWMDSKTFLFIRRRTGHDRRLQQVFWRNYEDPKSAAEPLIQLDGAVLFDISHQPWFRIRFVFVG
jgi:hypothetical protein